MRLIRWEFRGLSRELFGVALLCTALLASGAGCAVCASVPGTKNDTEGIVWNVRGTWHVEGLSESLLTGDPIAPGSLLEPAAETSAHSITVLLPDGQSILYECFTAKDCARGFRVPALYRAPDAFTSDMLARVRAALTRKRGQTAPAPGKDSHIARDETAVVLGPGNRIEIGGLAATLSNGKYSGDLQAVGGKYPEQSGIPLEKSGRSIPLTLPGPGLFLLTITDSLKWPRIEFMIAAEASQDSGNVKHYQEAHALLSKWNEDYFGWPAHDIQRAYLESLMLGIQPGHGHEVAVSDPPRAGVTAAPVFSPRAGEGAGDIAIHLKSATTGALIHFTVDSSQPIESSPVYRAPIIMKRLPLTIKAFAEAPGRKDSPVVTGNFRIRGKED